MPIKNFRVYFARTAVGERGAPMTARLREAVNEHGPHLPVANLSNDFFQMRDMERVGSVWKGSFVKLRDDAPHVVAADDQERELELEVGDRIIEKCYFLYRETGNVLVWQTNKNAGGLSRAQEYLSRVFDIFVALPQVMNEAELERALSGQLREIEFAYDRPHQLANQPPQWTQNAFDIMSRVEAAYAKFTLRAPKKGSLAAAARNMVRQLITSAGVKKIRVRVTDDSEPIELFMAPLKDSIRVEMLGRYPAANHVYVGLEEAFDRQRGSIPN